MGEQTFIDVAKLEEVGFVTTREEGVSHWTELRLFHRPGQRRPFLAETIGGTVVPGETIRRRQRVAATIEAAMLAFDNSYLSDEIAKQAQAWQDTRDQAPTQAPAIQFDGAGGLRGALEWLYKRGNGDTDGYLSLLFETDWGVPARTVRHTLKGEREGGELPSWCKAFLGALMHFDRDAFHACRRGDA